MLKHLYVNLITHNYNHNEIKIIIEKDLIYIYEFGQNCNKCGYIICFFNNVYCVHIDFFIYQITTGKENDATEYNLDKL